MLFICFEFPLAQPNLCPQDLLGKLCQLLGTPLFPDELEEAAVALDTNNDGLLQFDEIYAFWTAVESKPKAGIDFSATVPTN